MKNWFLKGVVVFFTVLCIAVCPDLTVNAADESGASIEDLKPSCYDIGNSKSEVSDIRHYLVACKENNYKADVVDGISWNPDTATLTLDGYHGGPVYLWYWAINDNQHDRMLDVTVEIKGENTITENMVTYYLGTRWLNVTFVGDGELTFIDSGKKRKVRIEGNLTIDGPTIHFQGLYNTFEIVTCELHEDGQGLSYAGGFFTLKSGRLYIEKIKGLETSAFLRASNRVSLEGGELILSDDITPSTVGQNGCSALMTSDGEIAITGTKVVTDLKYYQGIPLIGKTNNGSTDVEVIEVDASAPVYELTSRSIEDYVFSLSKSTFIYDGNAKEPSVLVEGLIEGLHYEYAISDNVNAGTGKVHITGLGNFEGEKVVNFTIAPKDISEYAFSLSEESFEYDGLAKTPAVLVDGLTEGTQYQYEIKDNVNAGVGKVVISGVGNYGGSKLLTFAITPKSILGYAFSLSENTFEYDGQPKNPAVLVDGLTEGTQYQYEFRDNVNAGTGKAVISGVGNYEGNQILDFVIVPKNIADCEIALETAEYIYDGMAKEPGVSVSGLVPGTDYEVSYSNNVEVGNEAIVSVTGCGNYIGNVIRSFSILAPPQQSGGENGAGNNDGAGGAGSGGEAGGSGTDGTGGGGEAGGNGNNSGTGNNGKTSGNGNNGKSGDSGSKSDGSKSDGSGNSSQTGKDGKASYGPKKGSVVHDKKYSYKVTKRASTGSAGTLEVTGLKKKSVKSIQIAAAVTIDGYAYKITSIGKNAFKKNKKITRVVVGKNVKTIGAGAFEGLSRLKQTVIESKVLTSIGKRAFKSDKKLKSITIRSSKLKKIGKQAFSGTSGKLTFKVPKKKKAAYRKLVKRAGNKKAKIKS